ncbi:MAG: hypothetical protein IPO51_12540 [Dehalococcoidia bacterium]|nr:hypothetical protein [Dehalococcoidia bacterium]
MREAGVETEVVHRLLFAGPSAASFVERQLEKERPDFVVIALSTYGVVVQLVSNRLRERFGQPVASAAERFERFVSRHPARHGSNQERALTAIRRGGRRLIGTRPSLTLSGLLESYTDCFSVLARAENVHTIVLGGASYTRQLAHLNPRLYETQAEVGRTLRAAALERHFDWILHEDLLGSGETRLGFFQPDGVHTDERSQRLVAEALLPVVLAKV